MEGLQGGNLPGQACQVGSFEQILARILFLAWIIIIWYL